ncbi:methylmalonyl-CoA carboxyltransferase [Clostridia bacterium]|nr:methylmalonyl-CoA carboxyltransferase [Clostridia bacterium]GHU57521.1 methylmalonyl-CoA carboxyltransferase [Clostridia bacterium]
MKKDRLQANERLSLLFDDGTYTKLSGGGGVITAYGLLGGRSVYAFAEDPAVKSGGVDGDNARKLAYLYRTAAQNGAPVVGIFDSNGGDISAPQALLAGYSDIAAAAVAASGVVPVVAVIAGVCGGIAAVLAASADFVVAGKDAELFLTPPFLAGTAGTAVKADGSATSAAKAGNVSILADDEKAAIAKAKDLISVLPDNNIDEAVFLANVPEGQRLCERASAASATVADAKLYRDTLLGLTEDVIPVNELFGGASGTYFGDCGGRTVGFVSVQGKLCGDDCDKVSRFVGFCDCYAIPVVTIYDTAGASCDNSNAVRAFAKLTQVYYSATTPKISVIKGEAVGSSAIASGAFCGCADFAVALDTATIAPLSVVAATALLAGKDKDDTAAYKTAVTAAAAAASGNVSAVVTPQELASVFAHALDITKGKRAGSLPRKHINLAY